MRVNFAEGLLPIESQCFNWSKVASRLHWTCVGVH